MTWTAEDAKEFERRATAPAGAVWVCGACGRNGKRRDKIGDESCYLNATLCVDDKPPLVSPLRHEWRAFK
jgi:hypothetical protein